MLQRKVKKLKIDSRTPKRKVAEWVKALQSESEGSRFKLH